MQETTIKRSESFILFINFMMFVAIASVILFAVGMLFLDIIAMIKNKYSYGIGNVLGSLLIIWVLMELIEAQLHHIKGAKMDASIFIMVAIVGFVRKLLVTSLKAESIEAAYFPLAAIFTLSLVYLIVKTTENRQSQ